MIMKGYSDGPYFADAKICTSPSIIQRKLNVELIIEWFKYSSSFHCFQKRIQNHVKHPR